MHYVGPNHTRNYSRKATSILFVPLFWGSFFVVTVLTIIFRILRANSIREFFRRKKKVSVLFLDAYPGNAGYYYRSYKWKEELNKFGISVKIKSVFGWDTYHKLYNSRFGLSVFMLLFTWKRIFQIFNAFLVDAVIVRREILVHNDYGGLFMEKFLRSINDKIILDYDDDISAAKREPRKIVSYGKLLGELPDKFLRTLRFYNYFTPGSYYLKNKLIYEQPEVDERNIIVLPTLVDYNHLKPKEYDKNKKIISFGWIGSPNNYIYLPTVFEALNNLSDKFEFDFILIGGEPFSYKTKFNMSHYQWSIENQNDLLLKIDVGLMPLFDDQIARGKCGFKLIQYMGRGIIPVASAITVNKDIIDERVNGFLVYDVSQWQNVLEEVILSREKYPAMGRMAFEKIRDYYSFDAFIKSYAEFLMTMSKN